VHEYREGKVKSTPMRGVKEILKPDAYKQWEGVRRRRTREARSQNARTPEKRRKTFFFWPSDILVSGFWFTCGEPLTAYLLYNGSAT
jgi:hypothetical protein